METGGGKRPRAGNKAETLLPFILTLFLKGNSYELHFMLILFCK